MPTMDQVFQRINTLCESLMASLPRNYAVDKTGINGWAFAVSKKRTPGDPTKNGQAWELVGGITYRQLVTIVNTTTRDRDALEKIRKCVLDGIDATVEEPAQSAAEASATLNAEIERRVAVEVRRHLEQTYAKATKVAQGTVTAKAPAAKPAAKKPGKAPSIDSIEVWRERAREMGIEQPPCRPSDPTKVDGRWSRRVGPQWDAHILTKEVDAMTGAAPTS